MSADPWDRIESLLDSVHAATTAGDFAALAPILDALEAIDPGQVPPSGDRLFRLRAKADRNARGLDAAGRGLRAAGRRLAEIASAARGLGTYGGDGRRVTLAIPADGPARRA